MDNVFLILVRFVFFMLAIVWICCEDHSVAMFMSFEIWNGLFVNIGDLD